MAYLVEFESKPKGMSTIPMVAEFSNFFPEELLGLPLKREVEFEIDLVYGMTPILEAPYRMTASKLRS